MSKKAAIKMAVGFLITVVIIYFSIRSFRGLKLNSLEHMHVNMLFFVLSILVYVYANYIRGLAYTRGIDPQMGRLMAFQIVGIGHALNMVLPLHAGEGFRLAFFPKNYSALRRTRLLVLPAYADFVAIMVLSVLAVPFSGFQSKNLLRVLWILAILCIAGIILSFAAVFLVPKLHDYFKDYLNFSLVKMMFWVFISWILLLISTWLSLVSFGFNAAHAIRMSLAVFASTNIINFIPASPGAIGLFEYGTILGLDGLGINASTALSSGLFLHVIQYISLLPLGAVLYILFLREKYKGMKRMSS